MRGFAFAYVKYGSNTNFQQKWRMPMPNAPPKLPPPSTNRNKSSYMLCTLLRGTYNSMYVYKKEASSVSSLPATSRFYSITFTFPLLASRAIYEPWTRDNSLQFQLHVRPSAPAIIYYPKIILQLSLPLLDGVGMWFSKVTRSYEYIVAGSSISSSCLYWSILGSHTCRSKWNLLTYKKYM